MTISIRSDSSGNGYIQTAGVDRITIGVAGVVSGLLNQGSAAASTTGTAVDFTSLPSWVKRITVLFNGVSLTGGAQLLVQAITGTSTVVSTGYTSGSMTSGGTANTTTAFAVTRGVAAADLSYGSVTLVNVSGNIWTLAGTLATSNAVCSSAGGVALGAALTGLRITNDNTGTSSFDAGSVNIIYEG